MNGSLIPACYFPSTVTVLGKSLSSHIDYNLVHNSKLIYHFFDAPDSVCRAIQRSPHLQLADSQIKFSKELSLVHLEVYNPHRFEEVSVLLMDLNKITSEPEIYLEQFSNQLFRKCLVVDPQDEEVARKALDKGLIQSYVRKNDHDFVAKINDAINTLHQQFFLEVSSVIGKILSLKQPAYFRDELFTEFFRKLVRENKIVEFYMADEDGDFLLFDENANGYYLMIKTEDDVNDMEENSNVHYLKAWKNSCREVQKIMCNQTYSYALLEEPFPFELDKSRLKSFRFYLDEQQQQMFGNNTSKM